VGEAGAHGEEDTSGRGFKERRVSGTREKRLSSQGARSANEIMRGTAATQTAAFESCFCRGARCSAALTGKGRSESTIATGGGPDSRRRGKVIQFREQTAEAYPPRRRPKGKGRAHPRSYLEKRGVSEIRPLGGGKSRSENSWGLGAQKEKTRCLHP